MSERPASDAPSSRLARLRDWRPGRLAQNTALATFWQGVRLALQIVYLVLVARMLGAEGYGYFAGVVALAASLSPLAGAGFSLILVKKVSLRLESFPVYWGRTLVAITLTAPLLIGSAWAAATLLQTGHSQPLAVLLVVSSELFLVPIVAACSNTYQAHEKLGVSAFSFVLLNLGRLLAIATLFAYGDKPSLTMFAFAYFGGSVIPVIINLVAVSRTFGHPVRNLQGMSKELREGLGFAVSGVANVTHGEIDKTLLLRMGGAAMTGYYSVASRVISAASVPLVTYVLAIAPRLFRAGETGVAAGWRSAWRLLLPILAYGALAGVGMFFLAALLPLLLGKDFSASVPIVRALATLPLLTGISNLLLAVLTCSGAQRVRILLETCSLGVNIALNVVLIPVLGALGAVASILASQMTLAGMAAAAIFYLSRRGIE